MYCGDCRGERGKPTLKRVRGYARSCSREIVLQGSFHAVMIHADKDREIHTFQDSSLCIGGIVVEAARFNATYYL